MLLFWTVVFMYYKTRENAHFLDHSMNVIQNPRKCSFLDPSIYEVTLYEIVQGGDFDKSREWFRSLRSLNHNNFFWAPRTQIFLFSDSPDRVES